MKEDLREMEIARVKGQIEATKHYYAVLIAKSASKVEDAMKWADEGIERIDETLKKVEEELEVMRLKLKRTKSKMNKIVLEQGINGLTMARGIRLSHRETLLKIRHQLKQVI